MKTKEELNALKNEVENLNKKLAELTEDELAQVAGGNSWNEYWGEDGYFRISQSNAAEEKKGYNVGSFPGVSGFP